MSRELKSRTVRRYFGTAVIAAVAGVAPLAASAVTAPTSQY